MNRAESKAQRLLQIEQLLWAHPEGLTQAEIARRINVKPPAISKYVANNQLPPGVYIDEFDGNKLKLDRAAGLTRAAFNLNEVMALHLATRLLATRTDKQNPHAASALRKLAKALQRLDHNVSQHLLRSADVMDEAAAYRDPVYLQVLETLTEAWSAGRKVRVTHLNKFERIDEYIYSPYFIEPYAVGQTTHVLGWCEPLNAMRTFKIERLRSAVMLPDRYTIPADFDPTAQLRNAWGIWYTDSEPVEVVLRFHPKVARRVQETQWQRGQQIELLSDGWLLWRALIAEPQEMVPWIRGWGADVEVVAPDYLRDNLTVEIRRMAKTYQIDIASTADPVIQRVLKCWGKTGKTDDEYHPALFHMIDVANVAALLLSADAPARFRFVLSQSLNTDADTLVGWLPWVIALHDIGKITASFQMQNALQKARLQKEGFSFIGWSSSDSKPHSVFSQTFVENLFSQANPAPTRSLQRALVEMTGGHHGIYHSNSLVRGAGDVLELNEPDEWKSLRVAAEMVLRRYFLRTEQAQLPKPENVSTATMMLSGFAILCDWIGSDSRFFTPEPDMEPDHYMRYSRRQAQKALSASGLLINTKSSAPQQFSSLFPNITQPRPLQLAVDQIPEGMFVAPSLVIIEAPTGEGKTEASLAIAHQIAQSMHGDDFYYALPTMATSNQMFSRLQEYLRDRLCLAAQVKLVHGQSFLIEDELRIEPLNNGGTGERGDERSAAVQWFNGKKRSLLAPFGVGTVDQAEMAALNARHMALRMFGLAGKVVIIDEVHAYDTYMTTIIEQLLRWLSKIGTSVILLSATLPLSRRARFVQAYGVEPDNQSELGSAYPSLLVVNHSGIYQASPEPWQNDRRIRLEHLYFDDDQVEKKVQWLLEVVQEGGCVCWMTNTVRRAQRMFERLLATAPSHVDLSLLHAQHPLEERQMREEEIARKYGPKGTRPSHGIVIGTQVLEQSLDLDFDIMVSDLAPIDLLLQRAGRLHRHQRTRLSMHSQPILWINLHSDEEPMIPPAADRKMYTEYILRQTWSVLAGRNEIKLPEGYRPLIEAVYDAGEPAKNSELRSAWDKLRKKESFAVDEANIRLVPDPDPMTPFSRAITQKTFEEDENSAAWVVARTRLGEESLNVIPLEVKGDYCILPDGTQVNLGGEADRETQLRLLRRGLRVSHQDAIHAIRSINEKRCRLFADSPLLKDQFMLPLENGSITLWHDSTELTLILHPQLGLVIERNKD